MFSQAWVDGPFSTARISEEASTSCLQNSIESVCMASSLAPGASIYCCLTWDVKLFAKANVTHHCCHSMQPKCKQLLHDRYPIHRYDNCPAHVGCCPSAFLDGNRRKCMPGRPAHLMRESCSHSDCTLQVYEQCLYVCMCRAKADGKPSSVVTLADRITVHLLLAKTLTQTGKYPEATKVSYQAAHRQPCHT